MPEWLCTCMVLIGFVFVFPVYLGLWSSIAKSVGGSLSYIDMAVVLTMLLPILLALFQSFMCAGLYLAYMPWFLFMIVFFIVYTPHYSFSRLFDTTWGNRATGRDQAINQEREATMKNGTALFMFTVAAVNIAMSYLLAPHLQGTSNVLGYMAVIFFPTIVQLLGAVFFLLFVMPLRPFFRKRDLGMHGKPRQSTRSTLSNGTSDMSLVAVPEESRTTKLRSNSARTSDLIVALNAASFSNPLQEATSSERKSKGADNIV